MGKDSIIIGWRGNKPVCDDDFCFEDAPSHRVEKPKSGVNMNVFELSNRTISIELTEAEILRLLERRPVYDQFDLSAIQKLNAGYSRLAERKSLEQLAGENQDD